MIHFCVDDSPPDQIVVAPPTVSHDMTLCVMYIQLRIVDMGKYSVKYTSWRESYYDWLLLKEKNIIQLNLGYECILDSL